MEKSKKKSGKKNPEFKLFLESTQFEEGVLNFQQLMGLTRTVESIIRGLGNFPRDAEDYTMNPLKETITHVEQLKNPDSNPYHIGSVSIAAPNLQTTSELDKAVRSWDRILGAKHDLRIKFEALDSIMNPTKDSKPYLVDEGEFRFIMGHFGIEIPNYEFLQIEEFPVQLNVLIQLVPRLLSTIGLPEIPVGLMHKLFYFSSHGPDVEGTGLPTISSMKWFKYYYKNDLHKFLNDANTHSIELPSFLEHEGPKTIEEISVASAESFCKQFDTIALSVIKPDFLEKYAFTDFDFEKIIPTYFEDIKLTHVVWKHKLFVEDVAYGLQNISEKYYGTMEYVDNTRSAANANQSQQESREDILAMNTVRLREEMRQKKRMKLIFLELSHNFLTSSGRDGVSLLCDMVGSNMETVPESTLEHFIDYCLMFEPRSILENCKESGNNDYDKFMLLVGQAPYARSATMEKLNERRIYVDCSRLPSNHPIISQDTFDGENACLVDVNVKSIDDSFLLFHIKCVLNKWIQDTENVINYRHAYKIGNLEYAQSLFNNITTSLQSQYSYVKELGGSALQSAKGMLGLGGSAINYFKTRVADVAGSALQKAQNVSRSAWDIAADVVNKNVHPITTGGDPRLAYTGPRPSQSIAAAGGGMVVENSNVLVPPSAAAAGGGSMVVESNPYTGMGAMGEGNPTYVPTVWQPQQPPLQIRNSRSANRYGNALLGFPQAHYNMQVYSDSTNQQPQHPAVGGPGMPTGFLSHVNFERPDTNSSLTAANIHARFGNSSPSSNDTPSEQRRKAPSEKQSLASTLTPSAVESVKKYNDRRNGGMDTSKGGSKTRKPKRHKKTLRRNPRKLMSRRQKYSRRK